MSAPAPDYTRYPNVADVDALLGTGGMTASGSAAAAGAAAEMWELRTGYRPFLAGGADTARVFSAPANTRHRGATGLYGLLGWSGQTGGGTLLQLGGGLVAAPSAVTVDGVAQLEGADFWCEPPNAVAEGYPFTSLRFAHPLFACPQGINITGRWGYGATVPAPAWQAILLSAASMAAPGSSMAAVIVAQTEDNFSESHHAGSIITPEFRNEAWAEIYRITLDNYRLQGA